MTAIALQNRCYVIRPHDDAREDPHFQNPATAKDWIDTYSEDDDDRAPEQLPEPCIAITCDNCDADLGDDEFDVVHFPTIGAAGWGLSSAGWTTIELDGAGDLHYCTEDECQDVGGRS